MSLEQIIDVIGKTVSYHQYRGSYIGRLATILSLCESVEISHDGKVTSRHSDEQFFLAKDKNGLLVCITPYLWYGPDYPSQKFGFQIKWMLAADHPYPNPEENTDYVWKKTTKKGIRYKIPHETKTTEK